MARASDSDGRLLSFANESVSGGFVPTYTDTGERYAGGHACWIDGIACHADEQYFGGIVVQRRELPVPRIELTDARVTLPCALAWRAIAEIARRRHRSHRLRLEQYHPGNSMRGALGLVLAPVEGGPAARHDFDIGGSEPGRWSVKDGDFEAAVGNVAALLAAEPGDVVTRLEMHARFEPPISPLPSGGRFLRAIRLVAGLLENRVFDRRPWRATLAAAGHNGGTIVGEWHQAFVPSVTEGGERLRAEDEHRLSQLVLIHHGDECVWHPHQYTSGLAIDLQTDRLVRMDRDGLSELGTVNGQYEVTGRSLTATIGRLAALLDGSAP